jgi:hypothetical protein
MKRETFASREASISFFCVLNRSAKPRVDGLERGDEGVV